MTKKTEKQLIHSTEHEQSTNLDVEFSVSTRTVKIREMIEGAVYPNRSSGLSGWVWDRSRPYHPLTVELLANNEVIAETVADKFDMELAEREIGNGKHAFNLSARLWPDLTFPVEISVRVAGTKHLLWKISVQNLADIEGIVESNPVGHVDGVVDGELRGWACDRFNFSKPISIDILDNNAVLETIVCTEFRKDLHFSGYGDGYCGFSFALPISLLDGMVHSITVCYSGTQRRLPNGALLFGLTKENELTKLISNLMKTVKQCRLDLATTEQRLIVRHEALLTIQRENIERELQVLRKLLIDRVDQKESTSGARPSSPKLIKPIAKNVAQTKQADRD